LFSYQLEPPDKEDGSRMEGRERVFGLDGENGRRLMKL
jgi:hypothetical protein